MKLQKLLKQNWDQFLFITARCTIVQSAVLHVFCPSVRLSVHLSVCDVGGSWPHRLKILETNCPKVIHLLPGEHGEILGRKCSFNTYVHNLRLNWVNGESHDLRWRCGCLFTFVGASRGVIFAIAQLSCCISHRYNAKRRRRDDMTWHNVTKIKILSANSMHKT